MAKEKAAFICVKDTLDGAYPSLDELQEVAQLEGLS